MNEGIEIRTRYDLPDSHLLKPNGRPRAMKFWIPAETLVVIGNGSKPENEIIEDMIRTDRVPVVRRSTGGCAVVLSREMAIVSFAIYTEDQKDSGEYFRILNSIIVDALSKMGVRDVSHKGRSDIAIGERKIAGTAIYRNKNSVFYHAVINVAGDAKQIDRYLKHPPREPEYRRNRKHSEFVTSLEAEGYHIDTTVLEDRITRLFEDCEEL